LNCPNCEMKSTDRIIHVEILFFYYQLFLLNSCFPSEFAYVIKTFPYSIFQIAKLGTKLKQDALQLSYTPRKFTTHPSNTHFYIIESDHRVLGEVAAAEKLQELVSANCTRKPHI
jgi:hypothetical protein